MEFASDMLNLRREIDNLQATRAAMMKGLNQFNCELKKSMAQKMSEIHHMFAEESARARTARHAFNKNNRHMVGRMMAAFGSERYAARCNFMGRSA